LLEQARGDRRAVAALAMDHDRPDVHDLVGGYKGWLAAKLPAATG
jgi:hypothetical protein